MKVVSSTSTCRKDVLVAKLLWRDVRGTFFIPNFAYFQNMNANFEINVIYIFKIMPTLNF